MSLGRGQDTETERRRSRHRKIGLTWVSCLPAKRPQQWLEMKGGMEEERREGGKEGKREEDMEGRREGEREREESSARVAGTSSGSP